MDELPEPTVTGEERLDAMNKPMSEKCKSFILFDGAADETWCIWKAGHLGCHSTWVDGKKIKWPKEDLKYQEEVASLRKQLEEARELVGRVGDYATHDTGCLWTEMREGRPTADGGYETLYGFGKEEKWYQRNEEPPCSCGLLENLKLIKEWRER